MTMMHPNRRPHRRRILIFLVGLSGLAWPQDRPRVLLSNDDGYQHPGLRALVDKLAPLAEVVVSAPAVNQSGVGHTTTFKEPIPVESWTDGSVRWHAVSASPATCVRLALESLLDRPPDAVISGINSGENLGVVTFSSGTVACARDAAFRGIPAISLNMQRGQIMDYDAAAEFAVRLLLDLKERGLPAGTYLNVNYPALPRDRIKGALITRLDSRAPSEHYRKIISPQGKVSYQSIWNPLRDGARDTDTWAISHGYISVTPLEIDQTLRAGLGKLRSWASFRPRHPLAQQSSGKDE